MIAPPPRRALIVMARQPTPGTTKTRLCPPLSPEAAAALYACFLADVIDHVRAVAGQIDGLVPGIAFTPPDATAHFAALAPGFELAPQIGATLGERLDGVLSGALARGYGQVAAVNSDSPSLPVAFLVAAFAALDDPAVDVVLGPCDDGGYYLIGWKRPHPALVRDVTMSAPDTLAQTLAVAGRVGLRVALLPRWYDVDGPPDLARLAGDPGLGRHTRAFLAP
jgi:rSAM/selenodomain-associated transferase 1